MDDIVSRVQNQILKDIKNYFKNEDKNVLMVCINYVLLGNWLFRSHNYFP